MSRCRALAALTVLTLLIPYIGIRFVSAAPLNNQVLEDINQPKPVEGAKPASSSAARSIKSISSALSDLSTPASTPIPAPAEGATPSTIPYLLLSQSNQQALIPDWSRISFTSFRFTTAGSLSNSVVSRQWLPGQTLDQVLTLGDFQDSFNLEGLNLFAVNKATGRDINGTRGTSTEKALPPLMLSDFKLMSQQTIGSLVQALPDLNKLPASQVTAIADLLRPTEGNTTMAARTIGDLLEADSNLGALRFDSLDLSKYKVSDIPGLDHAPFQAFKDWQQASIDDVPGLSDMPWSQFPTPPNQRGVIGQIAIPDSGDATMTGHSLSGSNVAGNVDCTQSSCGHVNLGGSTSLQGTQWFAGEQSVPGGTGMLADVSEGKEPTGRNIYGEAFKVVLDSIDKAGAHSNLYFHACQSQPGQTLISCSPYVIGPISFMSYANGDGVFLGALDWPTPVPTAPAQPVAQSAAPAATPLVVNLTDPDRTRKAISLVIVLVGLGGGVAYFSVRSWRKPKSSKPKSSKPKSSEQTVQHERS